ncbi:MAG: hypothetical protein AAFR47_19100 [Pseudomonadota bacterium]
MPLGEAVEITKKMFSQVRTSATDREVAVRTMGYSGITGRSGKVLANLIQFGLLEKAGKSEVRVTKRAVEILHPDSEATLAESVIAAASDPELFEELSEKFPGASASNQALHSYLLKRGFTDAAIPAAIRAYIETMQYAQQFLDSESSGRSPVSMEESAPDHDFRGREMRESQVIRSDAARPAPNVGDASREQELSFNMIGSRIALGGVVKTKADAEHVIATMQALKVLLKDSDEKAPATPSAPSPPSEQ